MNEDQAPCDVTGGDCLVKPLIRFIFVDQDVVFVERVVLLPILAGDAEVYGKSVDKIILAGMDVIIVGLLFD